MNNHYFMLLHAKLAKLLSCWRVSFLPFFFMAMLAVTFNSTAQNVQGTVPVQIPVGGFGVDGDAFANTPAPAGVGDWFYDSTLFPGSGRGLFTGSAPSDPTMTFFLQDKWGGDGQDQNIFLTSTKINDNPNSYLWGPGQVPNKNEIQNVGVHFTYGNAAILDKL